MLEVNVCPVLGGWVTKLASLVKNSSFQSEQTLSVVDVKEKEEVRSGRLLRQDCHH